MYGQWLGITIGILTGIIIIFLICREIVCWYWKINSIVTLLGEQNRLLGELSRKMGMGPTGNGTVKCQNCHKDVDASYTGCPHCGALLNGQTYQHTTVKDENIKETKKCKNCGIRVSIDNFKCPKCGGIDFIG